MPSLELAAIIAMLRANPITIGTVEQVRAGLDAAEAFPLAEGVRSELTDVTGLSGEWLIPDSPAVGRTILHLHGGGYVCGSIKSHRALASRIAVAAAAPVLLIEYRLGPEHPHPAAVDDAIAAYRWLLKQRVDPAQLVVAGDSAGGGLTAATLLALRDAGDPLPAAAVLMSPWTDLACAGESMTSCAEIDPVLGPATLREWAGYYLNGSDARAPLASPVYGDLSRLPPLLIQVGSAEVLLDDSTRLAERAQAAGVDVTLEVWDGMIHVWHAFAMMLPEGQQAIDRIGAWVQERLVT